MHIYTWHIWMRLAWLVGNGGTRSCKRSISAKYDGDSKSTRVLTAWATLTYAGPSCSIARRNCSPQP